MDRWHFDTGGSVKTGALKAMPDDRSNTTGASKTAIGSFSAQKDTPTGTRRPSAPQICCDRFANFCGQRQLAALATLAADAQLSRVPVNVFEFERYHFTGAQTQSREQEQDGVVATAHRGAPIDADEQLTDLLSRNRSGYR